jgi:hypothetical protein
MLSFGGIISPSRIVPGSRILLAPLDLGLEIHSLHGVDLDIRIERAQLLAQVIHEFTAVPVAAIRVRAADALSLGQCRQLSE